MSAATIDYWTQISTAVAPGKSEQFPILRASAIARPESVKIEIS